MSKTKIPPKKLLNQGRSRQVDVSTRGCNKPLQRTDLTLGKMNTAYIAHIVADSPDGPRGDEHRSELLAKDFNNLMLLCDTHHRLIDREDIEGHPEDRLLKIKEEQEKGLSY